MQDEYSPPEETAFRLENATTANVPVLIAVPHGGRDYPAALRDAMRDPAFTMKRIEDRHIDLIGERVAAQTGAPLLVITHDPELADHCERVLQLADGRIASDTAA